MNLRRGLFRIWLVASSLFVVAVGVITFEDVKKGFAEAALMEAIKGDDVIMPIRCGKARGIAGTDYTTREHKDPGPADVTARPGPMDTCYYIGIPTYRRLFPEHAKLTDKELTKMAYASVGQPTRDIGNPWVSLLGLIAWALAVPLVVLAIGAAILWAFSGFRRDTPA